MGMGIERLVAGASLVGVVLTLTACPGPPTTRDLNDSTAPTITLKIAGLLSNPGGVDDVPVGTTVAVSPGGTTLWATADDPNGVSSVELWYTEQKDCGGTITGPGLVSSPAAKTLGTVTPTQAPNSLSATKAIAMATHAEHGCVYTFKVWGKATNAATAPVSAQSGQIIAKLTR
jgi:hypothetical protein